MSGSVLSILISFDPPTNSGRHEKLMSILQIKNWGSESLRDLHKVTETEKKKSLETQGLAQCQTLSRD